MSLDEKIKAGGLLWASDVKQSIKELKEMIEVEEKEAMKYNNSISQAVRAILNGFKIQINEIFGEGLI